ncbi:LCP family protein [Actinokineospora guangxiensis]|uniref:LCP family protein n=1 Tax=Actinokineospora guangxiensis TaxID=1490288 RepID=A0ABW0EHJ5_9PSEU
MPDEYDGDGAPPSDPGGKRRAPDPDQPRRRRRSLDDGDGVSVSDLVERHSASRTDLPVAGRRRAPEESRHAAPEAPKPKRGGIEDLGAAMQGRRAAAGQADTPPSRHGRRHAPEQPPGGTPRSGDAHQPPADLSRPERQPAEPPRPAGRGPELPRRTRDGRGGELPRRGAPRPADRTPRADGPGPDQRPPSPPRPSDNGDWQTAEQPPVGDPFPPAAPQRPAPRQAHEPQDRPASRQPRDAQDQPHPGQAREPRSAHRQAPEARQRRAPRRPAPGQAGGPPMPPAEPGGPQRASIPADVVREATGAHRIPGEPGLDFDQFVPADLPRTGPAPRPAPTRPAHEPTHPGDLPEHDLPSKHYPAPPANPDRRPDAAGPHHAQSGPDTDAAPGPTSGPARRAQPTGQHQLPGQEGSGPRRALPAGDPEAIDQPRPRRRPRPAANPMPGEEQFAQPGPDSGPHRRPSGQHPLPGQPGPHAQNSGPHRTPQPPGGPPGQGRPGRRQPTGQHPLPAGAGPHRTPPADPRQALGGQPGPDHSGPHRTHPTGQHPLPGPDHADPHRMPPTGQHPMPGPDARQPGPDHAGPHRTGQYPMPDARRVADGPSGPDRAGPHAVPGDHRGVDAQSGPGGQDHLPQAAEPRARRQPTGQHPLPSRRRQPPTPHPDNPERFPVADAPFADGPQPSGRFPVADLPFTADGPQPSGRFPAEASHSDAPLPDGPFAAGPQPSGRMPRGPHQNGPHQSGPHQNGPQPTGALPVPHSEVFPDVRHPFPEPTQDRFPVDEASADISARLGGDKPRIPRQQPPGQSSMPPGEMPAGEPEATQKVGLTPPPGVSAAEAVGMTTEMEPIGEATQKRRRVDETLARFSKVHDELKAEEKAKRKRRMPWNAEDDELEEQLEELSKQPGSSADDEEKPKPKKKGLFAKVFTGTTAILVFLGTGAGWGFLKHTGDNIDKVRALDPDSAAIQNAEAQSGDENFLLAGSDTREGAEAEEGVGSASEVPGARADTMMIAHVPADRSRVVIVSFPRDLEIERPDCERFDPKTNEYTGENVPGQSAVKLNTAYQVGGPLCATKVVQELSGLRVTRFIGIDFHGFKGMVDAVDGVSVCVEEPMYDTFMNKWIVQEAGTAVELRGDQALDFVRSRQVRGDPTSDYGRIKRQQRFLSSLLRKAMSGQVLLDPAKLTGFTQAFTNSTFGDNITVESLFSLGQSLQGLEAGRVTFLTVPTVGIANDRGNEDLRVEDNAALFRAIVNNQPLPGEKPAETDEEQRALPQSSPLRLRQQQADPKTLKVQVLNGGNPTGGIAKRTGEALAGHGYQIVLVNSAPKVAKTVIYYGTGNEAAARTLASSVPGVQLKADASMGKALVLVLGPEFDGEVVAPGTAEVREPEPEKLPGDLSAINGGDVRCA